MREDQGGWGMRMDMGGCPGGPDGEIEGADTSAQ
jgi:hypothetical protein